MNNIRHHRCAFTLIELLVCIAVIVVLTALILPAVGKAKEHARTSECLSNQKQLVIELLSRMSESNQKFSHQFDDLQAMSALISTCPSDAYPMRMPELFGDKGVSYGVNPEYGFYAMNYDDVPAPAHKAIFFDGFADPVDATAEQQTDSDTGSFGGDFWYNGNKVIFTHFPPGNKNNPQLLETGIPAFLNAHAGKQGQEHSDLLGNWFVDGQFSFSAAMKNDFVRRHIASRELGVIAFLDGHAATYLAMDDAMFLTSGSSTDSGDPGNGNPGNGNSGNGNSGNGNSGNGNSGNGNSGNGKK